MPGLPMLFMYPDNVQDSCGQQETEGVESALLTLLPSAHSIGEEQCKAFGRFSNGLAEEKLSKTY